MCYHKLYIFTTCGHFLYGATPLQMCRHASIAPTSSYSGTCKLQSHPFHTLKIESLCEQCQIQRQVRLEVLEGRQIIRFEDWQWKVSYTVPEEGLTEPGERLASKKDVERERERQRKREKEREREKDIEMAKLWLGSKVKNDKSR